VTDHGDAPRGTIVLPFGRAVGASELKLEEGGSIRREVADLKLGLLEYEQIARRAIDIEAQHGAVD